MATLNSTISGSNTGDTLIGTESDQLISAGTGADSIGSQYASSSLVGSGGNDTFYANSKVPGVGVGSTLLGGSGQTALSSTLRLTSVQLYGNQDNDTIRLTGPTVETSLYGKGKTAFKSAIPLLVRISSPIAAMTPLMSLLALKTPICTVVRRRSFLSDGYRHRLHLGCRKRI